MLRFTICFFFLAISSGLASANNNHFLPGDAFFSAELSANDLAELRKNDPKKYIFKHSTFGQCGSFFCGHAGYDQALLEKIDPQFVEHLITAYQHIRKRYNKEFVEVKAEGKLTLIESNPIRVLFYPEDFNYPEFVPGLTYNENWVEECVKFGHQTKHLQLCEMFDNKRAVIESWKRSKEVGTFKFELFDQKKEFNDEINLDNPITLKGPIKAVVVPAFPLDEFVYGNKKSDLLIVEHDGVYQYIRDENSHQLIKTKLK